MHGQHMHRFWNFACTHGYMSVMARKTQPDNDSMWKSGEEDAGCAWGGGACVYCGVAYKWRSGRKVHAMRCSSACAELRQKNVFAHMHSHVH